MKVDLNCKGNDDANASCTISLPEGGDGYLYLHFESRDGFFGTLETKQDLIKLRKMIDKVLAHNKSEAGE